MTKPIFFYKKMKHLILLTILWSCALVGIAQTHVRQTVDDILAKHPEWIVNYGKSESASTNPRKTGAQANRIYHLAMNDASAIDSLLCAFDADKMEGYSYIRTSAAYNQATLKRRRNTVTLQNGERLESHSTEYCFVSLSVIDPEHKIYRTCYVLKWYPFKDGRTEAKLYILYGPRPNNQ